jgi:hypothetical protein
MADILISFTVPDAYVQRLIGALDHLDPGVSGTYKTRYIQKLRQWSKDYIKQSELIYNFVEIGDNIITEP